MNLLKDGSCNNFALFEIETVAEDVGKDTGHNMCNFFYKISCGYNYCQYANLTCLDRN